MLSKETYFKHKDLNRFKVKGQKKIFHANANRNKVGGAILILDKIDFTARNMTRFKRVLHKDERITLSGGPNNSQNTRNKR